MEKNIDSNKKTARVAGALFITATAASILSTPFLSPLNSPNYLTTLSASQNQTLIGVFLAFIGAAASASIAISLYPVLKKHNQSLSLGAVGFRLLEAVSYIVGIILLILLLSLSQEFVQAGAPTSSYFQTLGVVLLAGYHWASYRGGPAGFFFRRYDVLLVFYKTKLVPRWLSVWGLIGAALHTLSSLLVMFNIIGAFSTAQIVLNLPFIGVQEMVLAVWLIVKGFNSSAITSGAEKRS